MLFATCDRGGRYVDDLLRRPTTLVGAGRDEVTSRAEHLTGIF
jgi:hypothetical protein